MSENKSSKKTTWEKLKEEASQNMTENESTTQQETKEAAKTTPTQITHPSYEALEEKLQKAEMQLEEAKSQLIQQKEKDTYRLAEIENIQRRAKLDVENAYKYSLEHIIKDLLPVKDSLESALVSITKAEAENDPTLKGVQLTLQSLQKVLEKNNVLSIEPAVGDSFDAHYHQAMLTKESTEFEPNTIIKVLQKGYLLNNRLIRPAFVVVTKAVEKNT